MAQQHCPYNCCDYAN